MTASKVERGCQDEVSRCVRGKDGLGRDTASIADGGCVLPGSKPKLQDSFPVGLWCRGRAMKGSACHGRGSREATDEWYCFGNFEKYVIAVVVLEGFEKARRVSCEERSGKGDQEVLDPARPGEARHSWKRVESCIRARHLPSRSVDSSQHRPTRQVAKREKYKVYVCFVSREDAWGMWL